MSAQFDLEQDIMHCWSVVDDIKALRELEDLRKVSDDERQNYLLGLQTIYQVKFEKLFNTFEQYLKEQRLKRLASENQFGEGC